MNTKIITLGVALSTALIAGSAQASCSAAFDGVWSATFEADGQCAVELFSNDSANGQTNSSTWTNLSTDCDAGSPSKILDAEYDNLRHGNLTLTMVDANTCELAYAEAVVTIDTYGAWVPLSDRARLTVVNARQMEMCYSAQGHQFGQCVLLDYRGEW